jgi:hypothetical protein
VVVAVPMAALQLLALMQPWLLWLVLAVLVMAVQAGALLGIILLAVMQLPEVAVVEVALLLRVVRAINKVFGRTGLEIFTAPVEVTEATDILLALSQQALGMAEVTVLIVVPTASLLSPTPL